MLTKNSKLLLYGQSLSYMGDYCVLPALLILSTYYDNYWVTSGIIIARSIPMVLQPLLGVLVDRYNRVKIMFWTDIIRGVVFLLIPLLPKGDFPILFIVLLFISYGSGVFFNPARLSIMASLGDDIKTINTLFAKGTTFCIMIGALIGALCLFLGSIEAAVVFNSITYFISAFLIAKMDINTNKTGVNQFTIRSFTLEFKDGLMEIKQNIFVLNAIFTMMTMALLWGIMYSYFPIVSNYLNDDQIGNFILTICIGLGGFLGAQLVTKWGFNSNKGLIYFISISLITMGLFLFSENFIFCFVSAIGFFITMEYGEVLAKVKVQEHSANEMQGRIFAVSECLIGLFISLGSTLINFMSTEYIYLIVFIIMLVLFGHTIFVNKIYYKNCR